MNLIRLIPIIYVITPLGDAEALFLQVPETDDNYAQWGCFQSETKENWWWNNKLIRIVGSMSAMRDESYTDFYLDEGMLEMLRPHILRHKKSPLYEKITSSSDSI